MDPASDGVCSFPAIKMTRIFTHGLTLIIPLLLASPVTAQTWQRVAGGYPPDAIPTGVGPLHSSDAPYVLAGTIQQGDFKSTDGGLTWTPTGDQIFDGVGRVISAYNFFRTSTGRVFRGGGTASWDNRVGSPLWYSDNDGDTWIEVPYPFTTPPSNIGMAVADMIESGGALFISDGASDGVWKSTDDGLTWSKSRNGLPVQAFVPNGITLSSGIASFGNTIIVANITYGPHRSTDGGASWSLSAGGIPGTTSVLGTVRATRDVVATPDGTFYAGVDNGLWRSTDDGLNWTEVSDGFEFGVLWSIGLDGNKVYVFSSNSDLLESTDGGESFAVVDGGTPPPYSSSNYRHLIVQNGIAFYATSDGLYRLNLASAARTPILPSILSQPVGGGVNVGSSFTFNVTTTRATAPISYAWMRGDTLVATTDTPTYTIASAVEADAGDWKVVITNGAGTVESSIVSLLVAPNTPGNIDYTLVPVVLPSVSQLSSYSIAAGRDGEVFVGGSWIPSFSLTPPPRKVLRMTAEGQVDFSFVPSTGDIGGEDIFALFPLADGSVLVGGGRATGSAANQYFRKFNRAGTVEPAFRWVNSVSGTTFAFLESTGDTVILGGTHGLHRLSTIDGLEYLTFNPPVFVGNNIRHIRALSALPDGRFYGVGNFTTVNGLTRNRIARFHPDGAVDLSFDPAGTGVSKGLNGEVYAVAAQPDGKVLVAGTFSAYGGSAVPLLIRINADGSLDSSFQPGTIAGGVIAIAVGLDGSIYLGGSFSTIAGTTCNGLARLDGTTGALDTSFPFPGAPDEVRALSVQADGRILVATARTAYRLLAPATSTPRIARFSRHQDVLAGGQVTLSVTLAGSVGGATFQWFKDDEILPGEIASTLELTGFNAGAVGAYRVEATIGGTVLSSPVSQVRLLGKPDFRYQPIDTAAFPGVPASLLAEVRGSGTVSYQWYKNGSAVSGATSPFLYFADPAASDAGTYFLRATNLAGSTDSDPVYLSVVPRPLSVDPGFRMPVAIASTFETLSALPLPDGTYLVGGYFSFTTPNGAFPTGTHYLIQVDSTGAVIRVFNSTAYDLQAAVRWLAYQPDGKIIVGDARSPNRLTASLELDPTFATPSLGGFSENVNSLLVQPDGKILVGYANTSGTYPRFARLTSNGAFDTTFPVLSPNGSVSAIHRDDDGSLILGGSFSTIGGVARNNLARIRPDGTVDPAMVPAAFNSMTGGLASIDVIRRGPDGELYAGGNISRAGAVPVNGLARINADGSADDHFYLSSAVALQARVIQFLSNGRMLVGNVGNHIGADLYLLANGARDTDSGSFVANFGSYGVSGLLPIDASRSMALGAFSVRDDSSITYQSPSILFTGPASLYLQTSPASTSAELNGSVTLTAGALGTSAVSYQWSFEGEIIPGATGATYTINPVLRANEGNYTVTVTNASGSQTSRPAYVDVLAEPEIVTSPVGVNKVVGQTVSLTVVAKGAGTLSYRWLRNGQDLADAGNISGSGTTTLTLTNAQVADSNLYAVRITNALGNITSATVQVNVVLQPGLPDAGWSPAAPNNSVTQILVRSDNRIFVVGPSITAFGSPQLTRRYVGLINEDGTLDSTFAPTATLQSGYSIYRAELGPDGTTLWTVASNGFSSYLFRYDANGTATLLSNIQGVAYDLLVESDNSVIVVGSMTPRIQRFIVDGSTATLDGTFTSPFVNSTVTSIEPRSTGGYWIGGSFTSVGTHPASNLAAISATGVVDTSFQANSSSSPTSWRYLKELADGRVIFGGQRYLATGALDPSWTAAFTPSSVLDMVLTLDGKLIVAGNFTSAGGQARRGLVRLLSNGTVDPDFTVGTGSTSGALAAVGLAVNGRLYVGGSTAVFNGQSVSRIFRVNHEPTDIAFVRRPVAITANLEGSASFSAEAFGTTTVGYQWFQNGAPLADDDRFSGATTPTLTINPVSRNDAADYSLRITNSSGTLLSSSVALTVLAEPELITASESGPRTINSTVTLSATVVGATPLTYAWTRNGDPVSNAGRFSGATTGSLVITGIQMEDAGQYVLTATNTFGSVSTDNISVSVIIPPADRDASFPTPSTLNNQTVALVTLPDGRSLVGGSFTSFGGLSRNYLALLDATGAVDPTWTPPVINWVVSKLFVMEDGGVLVAGSFSAVNGDSTNYQYLFRLKPDLTLDTTFRLQLNNAVKAITQDTAGRLIIGGNFTSALGVASNRIIRLKTDFTRDSDFQVQMNAAVEALLTDASGNVIVGGSFSSSGNGSPGGSGPAYLARILPNGTLDTTWAPRPNSAVLVLANAADGGIIVGGQFTSVASGTVARSYLARYDADGVLDPNFNPAPNSTVYSLAVQDNGRILVSGTFTSVNGLSRPRLARLLASGADDPNFEVGSGLGTNSGHYAQGMTLTPQGQIWLLGAFTSYKGASAPYLLRLNGDPVELAFSRQPPTLVVVEPGTTFTLPASANGTSTLSYAWTRDGDPLPTESRIIGADTATLSVGEANKNDSGLYQLTISNLSGSRQSRLSQVVVLDAPVITSDPAGAHLARGSSIIFRVEALGAATLSYTWRRGGVPLANGGRVSGADTNTLTITGLQLVDAGSYDVVVSNSIGSSPSNSAELTIFVPPAGIDGGFDPSNVANNQILSTSIDEQGRLLVAGGFSSLRGTSHLYLGRLDAEGNRDTTFIPAPNSTVLQAQALPGSKVLAVGYFTTIGGQARQYLARLNENGSVDDSFTPPVFSGYPEKFWILDDGKIMVAGSFTSVGGLTRRAFVRLQANGTLDESFDSSGASGTGYAMLALDDGGYLLGLQGSYSGGSYFVKVDGNGVRDASFNLNASYTVNGLYRRADGGILVFGEFGAFNGVNRAYFAALNADLTHDATWGSTLALNNSINAFALQDNGRIVLGGAFTDRVMRVEADGTKDASFGVQAFSNNATVKTLSLSDLGAIWVGGSFASYGGVSASYLLRLNGDPVDLAIVNQPMDAIADAGSSVQFQVGAIGTTTLQYQWRFNGENLTDGSGVSGSSSATLTLSALTKARAGVYDVIVSNESGEVPSETAALTILAEPVLVAGPASQVVFKGSSPSLTASFAGAATLTYAWTFNGELIPEAAGASLSLADIQTSSAGIYVVTASNSFGSASSAPVSISVAAPSSSTLDAWPAASAVPNGIVYRVVSLSDGSTYLAGSFTLMGATSRNGIARVLPNGELDPDFTSPFAASGTTIRDLAPQADGSLYVVGLFTAPAGASSGGLIRLTSTGAVDTAFQPPVVFNTEQFGVRTDASGRVYVAGQVLSLGVWGYYGRVSSTGALDPSYLALPYQYGGGYDVELLDDTGIALVGGDLALGSGAFRYLYKVVPPNAVPDFSFNGGSGTNGTVYRLHRRESGGFAAAGSFTSYGAATRGGVVLFDATGNVDAAFAGAIVGSAGSMVRDLADAPEGALWVAGDFASFNGTSVGYLTRLTANGEIDTTLYASGTPSPMADAAVQSISRAGGAGLVLGGSFANVLGQSRPYLARLGSDTTDSNPVIVAQPLGVEASVGDRVVLRVAATGGGDLTFQWLRAGNSLPGQTGPELVIAEASEADSGTYTVVVFSGGLTVESDPAAVSIGAAPTDLTFAAWAARYEMPVGKAGLLDDADDDGVRNLLAFAYGMDPVAGDRSRLPASAIVTIDGARYLQFSYVRRTDAPTLTYTARAATTVLGLSSPDLALESIGEPEPLDGETERVTLRLTTPLAADSEAFVDLQITIPEPVQ